jgi:hypothetical protein
MIPMPPQYPIARAGAGCAPPRRPSSVRRTTSIDTSWPNGVGQNAQMVGIARDILTVAKDPDPRTLATGHYVMTLSPAREIMAIRADPLHANEQRLVGVRAGGASRDALCHLMGDVRGLPLFHLIDDFAGASLVAGWIWSHWDPTWLSQMLNAQKSSVGGSSGPRPGICTGFAEGSTAFNINSQPPIGAQNQTRVSPLENADDPGGWHKMPRMAGPQARRARRIDVWLDQAMLHIDAGFQDSGLAPDGSLVAIHEYRVHAVVDPKSMVIVSLKVCPLILPFAECPGATLKASRVVGQPLATLRETVLTLLPGIDGCTHLNDTLRGLEDVPVLALHLMR